MDILDLINFNSKYPWELLVAYDKYYRLIQTRLDNPHQRNAIGYTLLHVAAQSRTDNASVVQLLIDRGADVNATTPSRHTPLHFAVRVRKRYSVEALIKAGASINAKDFQGRTALHFAVGSRWSQPPMPVVNVGCDMWVVEQLLRNPEIDPNALDNMGETPLMWAVKQQNLTVVNALLKRADPDIPNKDERTPLHIALAAQNPHRQIIFTLLENGAGIYCVDKLGQTPVDILLGNVKDDVSFVLAEECVKLIALRYHISDSLKNQLEKFPVLSERLKSCCEEARLMRQQIVYDNVTLHDFVCDCFQSQDFFKEVYNSVVGVLQSGLYKEYHNIIRYSIDRSSDEESDFSEFEE